MMTPLQYENENYSRFFPLKQKVYLINMSRERDKDQYNSLSGTIIAYSGDTIDLQVPYSTGQIISSDRIRNTTFKIVTESIGVVMQIAADLVNISAVNILCLRLNSVLEVVKRCEMPRIDSTIKVFHHREDSPLSECKTKFIQIVEREKYGLPLHITLQESQVNVSVSGFRLAAEPTEKSSSPLAMCVLDLEDGQPPVCAIAETAWHRRVGASTVIGHRFITILKSDQKRIGRYVSSLQKSMGIKVTAPRNNWMLLDRMTFDNG